MQLPTRPVGELRPDDPPGDRAAQLRFRARFQPLLLAGAALIVVPLLLGARAPAWTVAYLVATALVGAALWARLRWRGLLRGQRHLASLVMAMLAVGGLLVVMTGAGWEAAADLVLLIAALGTVVAIAPDRRFAWSLQAIIIGVLFAGLVVATGSRLVAALIALQVLVIVVIVDTFARRLSSISASEQRARQAAERRGELLAAVRAMPRTSVQDAEEAVTETLRDLGFDFAGIVAVDGDHLVERVVDGLEPVGEPVERGRSLSWQAITEDRTLTTSSYDASAYGLPGRESLRGAIVAPIRVDSRPVGALTGGRFVARRPSDDEVEIVEVMAAHLGSVMANQEAVSRQQELLQQAAWLDRMGRGLLEAVSEEIRDPLLVLRQGARRLMEHVEDLDDRQRAELLGHLRAESEELRLVIDTMLDFSRLHARRADPHIEVTPLELLLQVGGIRIGEAGGAEERRLVAGPATARSATVLVDRELADPALALLAASGRAHASPGVEVQVVSRADGNEVGLAFPPGWVADRGTVGVSVAVQLLTAAGGRLELEDRTARAVVWFQDGRNAAPDPEDAG